jgi:hypothetical protein
MNETSSHRPVMSDADLAALGGSKMAFVRPLCAAEAHRIFPDAPQGTPDQRFFALLSADGTPLSLVESREAAMANAWQNELVTVAWN